MKTSVVMLATLSIIPGFAGDKEHSDIKRIEAAQTVFQEIMQTPDKGIPRDLLEKAHCLVIVPAAKRAGFIVGGSYGVGVATCRQPDRTGWTAPSTVKMEGGSVGFQIGAGETDVIMMVMSKEGADELRKSKFTLGGDAAVMAGPVGRASTAETDALMHAKILSYSRSRGVFAGIALKGSTLRPDDEANRNLYGKSVSHSEILTGKVAPPAGAQPLLATLNQYSMHEEGHPPTR